MQDNFYDGLKPGDRTKVKRPIVEEHQIITTTLHEYPELERRFNEYQLQRMSRPLGSYQPNVVPDFFDNYLALLKKDLPNDQKAADRDKLDVVPVRGVDIDISESTLNRFLFGPDYQSPWAIPELEHRFETRAEQRPWLVRVLTDGGDPSWLHNSHEYISKKSLSFLAKFWWAIVRLRLMPTGGDD